MRYRDRLAPGGFRYLLENGVHYSNAHYRHANTETAVGHATLVTGADPSRHGIVGNDWIEPSTGALALSGCPDRRPEYFLPNTTPQFVCPAGRARRRRGEEDIERGFLDWLRRNM